MNLFLSWVTALRMPYEDSLTMPEKRIQISFSRYVTNEERGICVSFATICGEHSGEDAATHSLSVAYGDSINELLDASW